MGSRCQYRQNSELEKLIHTISHDIQQFKKKKKAVQNKITWSICLKHVYSRHMAFPVHEVLGITSQRPSTNRYTAKINCSWWWSSDKFDVNHLLIIHNLKIQSSKPYNKLCNILFVSLEIKLHFSAVVIDRH